MSSSQQVIDLILNSKHWTQVFPKKSIYKELYKDYSKLIHPDICSLPKSQDAFSKLALFKKQIDETFSFKDDSGGTLKQDDFLITIEGEPSSLKTSYENYLKIKNTTLSQYLGSKVEFKEGILKIHSEKRMVSLKDLILPENHFRWVFNRLLSFSALLQNNSFVHLGITPETIFIVPETHGIVVSSLYHMRPVGAKLKTVSNKYYSWYHPKALNEKTAMSFIDTEMSKRTALTLLDTKPANKKMKEFLQKFHPSSIDAFFEYRKLLKEEYVSKFYELEI